MILGQGSAFRGSKGYVVRGPHENGCTVVESDVSAAPMHGNRQSAQSFSAIESHEPLSRFSLVNHLRIGNPPQCPFQPLNVIPVAS